MRIIRRLKKVFHWGALLALSTWAGLPATAAAEKPEIPEYELKAAFLFNFAKFITWPPESFPTPDSPIVLAVLGENPFGPSLEQTLAGKSVNGRLIKFAYPQPTDPIQCHILFVSSSEKEALIPTLQRVAGRPILTVGDFDRFAHRGGMINMYLDGKALRFRINANATDRAGLKVSSKLGGLGVVIRGDVVESPQ